MNWDDTRWIGVGADAHTVSYAIIYFSACINPIIYVTMNRQYRQAYKSLLFCAKLSEYRTTSPSADANTERNMSGNQSIIIITQLPPHSFIDWLINWLIECDW